MQSLMIQNEGVREWKQPKWAVFCRQKRTDKSLNLLLSQGYSECR
jgi:hypothetical protein